MAARKKVIFETPNRRMRKRRRLMRKSIYALFMLALILTGIFYFFRIPSLQIFNIDVAGVSKVDESFVRQEAMRLSEGRAMFFIPKTFFLAYPRKEIAASLLAKYNEVSDASVSLKGINRVEIRIKERAPFAFFCNAACYVADENGMIYESALKAEGKVIFRDKTSKIIGTYPLPTETFKSVEAFARRVDGTALTLVEVLIDEEGSIYVITEEGKIIISTKEPLDPQYEFLKIALSQSPFTYPDGAVRNFSYIDLRFGKKIFYKMYETPSAPSASSTIDI